MVKSVALYAREYGARIDSENWMMPAENLVRAIKICGLSTPKLNAADALDFGCGEGRNTSWCLELGYNVVATDLSIEAIRATELRLHESKYRNKLSLHLIKSAPDLLKLNKEFNLIIAWEVLHWLGSEELWQEFFCVASHSLQKSGSLVFTMPTETHFLITSSDLVAKDTYIATVESRKHCQFYAPSLSYMKDVFQSLSLKLEFLGRYEHGREGWDASIDNRFSMYIFVLRN